MQGTDGSARPVFVDPSGRRSRVVARTCWALGGLGVAYVALVVVSLLLPPSLSRLTVPGLGRVLPGPGAAVLGAAEGVQRGPDVLSADPPAPRAAVAPAPRPSAVPTPGARRASPAAASAPPPVTRAPAQPPRATPTRAAGRPSTAPTRRSTTAPTAPPGPRASRTPKPRPTRGPR